MDFTFLDDLKYNADSLIPTVAVDHENGEVLMVAYMNKDSLKATLEKGLACYWSRSRQKYWVKGESSGHTQEVKGVYTDCDKDTIVLKVDQKVAACHLGFRSCFFRKLDENGQWQEVAEKVFDPDQAYSK